MTRFVWLLIACAVMTSEVRAQPALPKKTLDALKAGTVFVRDGFGTSGSGFVVAIEEDQVFCMTNAHVVRVAWQRRADLEVVFDAGLPNPRAVRAVIAAYDEDNDLAVLSLSVASSPKPLILADRADAPETTPVFVLGFPFGEMLTPRQTPPVTVSRASIGAIRRDADGLIEHLQLDGEINPGNSGGPVVDGAGRVIGVAVAKLNNTNISFAVSVESAQRLLAGRVSRSSINAAEGDKRFMEFRFTVHTLDPLHRIRDISIMTALAEKQNEDVGKPGAFKPLAAARRHKLDIENSVATGAVRISRRLAEKPHVFQIRITKQDGAESFTQPGDIPLEAAPAPPEDDADVADRAIVKGAAAEPIEHFGVPEGPLDGEAKIALPDEIECVEVAGGGRYLVLKLRDIPALVVVDLFTADSPRYIRLPSTDFLYGAGGHSAVVYFRAENVLHRYDLITTERTKSKPNPFGPTITNIIMGHSRGGRAIVRYAVGTDALSRAAMAMLDTQRLVPIDLPSEPGKAAAIQGRNSFYRDATRFRANGDMSMLTEWATSHSPRGVGLLVWQGDHYDHFYSHDSPGNLAIGDDGYIYTSGGRIYDSRAKHITEIGRQTLIPGMGGVFFLSITGDGKMTIHQSGKTAPISQVGEFPDWPSGEDRRPLDEDRRILFLPQHQRIALIPKDDKQIIIRNFDLKAILDAADVDYLVVKSLPGKTARLGEAWTYQMDVISRAGGMKYELQLGPDGMKVSDAGLVTWTPKKKPDGAVTVIIHIRDESGEETFHKFDVSMAG